MNFCFECWNDKAMSTLNVGGQDVPRCQQHVCGILFNQEKQHFILERFCCKWLLVAASGSWCHERKSMQTTLRHVAREGFRLKTGGRLFPLHNLRWISAIVQWRELARAFTIQGISKWIWHSETCNIPQTASNFSWELGESVWRVLPNLIDFIRIDPFAFILYFVGPKKIWDWLYFYLKLLFNAPWRCFSCHVNWLCHVYISSNSNSSNLKDGSIESEYCDDFEEVSSDGSYVPWRFVHQIQVSSVSSVSSALVSKGLRHACLPPIFLHVSSNFMPWPDDLMVFRSWILKNFQKMKRKHLNFLRTTFPVSASRATSLLDKITCICPIGTNLQCKFHRICCRIQHISRSNLE